MAPRLQIANFPVRSLFRQEKIEDITMSATNQTFTLRSNGGMLPRDRFITGLFLDVSFRVKTPAATGPTVVNADAPFSMISNLTVKGKHRIRKSNDTLIDLSGPALAELQKNYHGIAPTSSGTLGVTANTAYDIAFTLFVPFTMLGARPQESVNYLCDAPNYETLELNIRWADEANLYTVGASASSITAYGANSGSPNVAVSGLFATEPVRKFANFIPGRIARYSIDGKSGIMTTTNTAQRIVDIPRGGVLRSLLIKTGTLASVTSGNRAYLSLSDSLLANIRFNYGLKRSIYDFDNFRQMRAHSQMLKRIAPSTGYAFLDFVHSGNLAEAWNLSNAVAGSTGDVDSYLQGDVTGAASQNCELIVEEIQVGPSTLGKS